MNKTKRVLSVVLAVLMLSSLIAALAIADGQHTVVINYVFENGKQAAPSWTATLAEGSSLEQTVTSPTVVGYAPDQPSVDVFVNNITENKTYTVTYHPANVGFTVNHYLQNVADNNYTLDKTEEVGGFTESEVGDGLAETYPGFAALLYNTKAKVAADGSTVVEIYYDRNYYMMSFNLDGGYGVEPIYARFGASVKVENPTKPGYTFSGWEPTVPTTVPAENTTYKAKWQAEKTAKVTVVVWGENADDENYSYIKSVETTAPVGATLTAIPSGTNLNMGTKLWELKRVEQTTVAADGSSVLNVYYDRKEFTLTFKYDYHSGFLGIGEGYKKTGTITAKWGADIGSRFLAMNAAAKGSLWSTNYSGAGPWTSFLQIMPEENRTYYCQETSNTAQSAYYYTEGLDGKYVLKHTVVAYSGSNLTITAEDFYPMEGFTYDHGTDGDGNPLPSNPGKAGKWSGAKFYYKRNSYDLVFISNNTEVKTSKVKFEAALGTSGGESFVPAYPSNFEPNAFEFAGWYQDPEGVKPVDWNAKMPAASVTVYAKWVPKTHTVKTFLTKEKIEENDPIDTWDNVPHGTAVTNTPADPQNGSYVFVGWFYMDGNVEKAFDFSMPVVKDLNLYAKWSSNTLVTYTIYYKSGDTEIAEPTTGSALAGTTLTFEAKTGDELNEGYQSGYFPNTGSHSLTMDINGNNEFTFVYVAKEKVNYTVRYLEKGTEKVLHEEKTAETSNAIITEKFVQISGYAPDAYQKRLVLSANEAENVITFWYTEDNVHAPVQIVHWIQNIAGEGYTEYQSSTNLNGEIGQTYTGIPLTIPGFTYNAEKSNASGELTAEGLELNLYYDRVKYSYTVRYVDAADNNKDIDPEANVTGEGLFGAQVIGSQKEFNGYMPADNEPKQKSIIIGTGTNEIIFYYYPCYYIGHVRSGSLNNTDTIRLTSSKANLTAAVTPGYLYGGAFTNEACDADHVQTFTQGENAINFTPVKGKTYYIWEVSETYLKPRAYVVSRHDPNAKPDANGSTLNVVGLYLTSSVDRNMYSEVGFTVDGTNIASDGGKVYDKVQAVYTDGSGVKEEMYVMNDGVWDVQAQAPAPASRGGYVSICTVSMDTFYKKSAESPLSYQPYWVTLDGIKVTGAYEARTCYYQGVGNGDIAISNCVDSDSAVSIYRASTTNTIGVESVAVLSAAPETVQPEVPVTPEIPEVPEAPEMTLNSDAMYLRAQYTYEMMTNTVKFISAIDVNECTEYGFVINGEVVKCEEAAETVDGYDANYLFGGSVNGAMLMSCNMLLDGLVDGMTLNVTPYYVALDGTTVVYGETRTLVYRQWVGLEG